MVENELAKALSKLRTGYKSLKKTKYPKYGKILVGRSPALSSLWEQEVAIALENSLTKLNHDYMFFVDYPISLYDKAGKYQKTFYPDILVVKGYDFNGLDHYLDGHGDLDETIIKSRKPISFNSSFDNKSGKIVAIIDLKIDIGYLDKKKFTSSPAGSTILKHKACTDNKDWRWNHIVGGYSHSEKIFNDNIGPIVCSPANFENIPKFAIVATEQNDHKNITWYNKAMSSMGYETLYLLDINHHPNHRIPSKPVNHFTDYTRGKTGSLSPSVVTTNIKTLKHLNLIFK